MRFNNNFIGYSPDVQFEYFSGSDTLEVFNNNLKTQSENWYYRNTTITYERNSNGHRCKEINDIDLDNYILFAGCSHTEGIGLELEKTYPYIVSNQLGMDYYNMSLGATGTDTLFYNLVQWKVNVRQKPKLLVIQWPNRARYLKMLANDFVHPLATRHVDRNERELREIGIWNALDDEQRFLVLGDSPSTGYFHSKKVLFSRMIDSLYNYSKIIKINYGTLDEPEKTADFDWDKTVHTDYARDLRHCGIETNNNVAEKINQYLSSAQYS